MENSSNITSLLERQSISERSSWQSDTLHQLGLAPDNDHVSPQTGTALLDRSKSVSPVSTLDTNQISEPATPTPQQLPTRTLSVPCEGSSTKWSAQPRPTIFSWSLEILAVVVSTLSMVAAVSVLARENGKPIAAWTFTFSLNTVIATLGTVCRTTLAFAISACIGQQRWNWLRRRPESVVAFGRFDEASRGPWGATRLCFWLRFRHWAALGALVTVGAVAFDPFLQAVISTYGQLDSSTSSSQATIGTSLRMHAGTIISHGNLDSHFFHNISSRPDYGLISSIYAGFHNDSALGDTLVKFECPTGNCSFTTFSSAAVCSSCKDVSGLLALDARYGENGSNVPYSNQGSAASNFTVFSLPTSEIRNFNGYVKFKPEDWFVYTTGEGLDTRTLMTVNTTYNPRETLKFSKLDTMITAFTILKASDDWLRRRASWESSKVTASECALYFCANAYQTRSENSVLKEDVLGSWTNRDPDSFMSYDDFESRQEKENVWIRAGGIELYRGNKDVLRDDLRIFIHKEDLKAFPATMATEFNISYPLIRSTIDFMVEFTTLGEKTPFQGLRYEYQAPTPFPHLGSPRYVDALWNSTNLTLTFENVARSITNQIRNTSPTRQNGTVHEWVIHVRVDWEYLAFPIAILLTGILYVVLTIIESTRLEMPVWKERALPTLLYGFDDETQSMLRARERCGSTEKEELNVRFGFDEKSGSMRLVADMGN